MRRILLALLGLIAVAGPVGADTARPMSGMPWARAAGRGAASASSAQAAAVRVIAGRRITTP